MVDNHDELITTIIIPVIKPILCDTAVTAKAGWRLVNLPPRKSALPHNKDENKARIVAIS